MANFNDFPRTADRKVLQCLIKQKVGCRPRVLVRYRQTPVYTHRQTAHEYGRLLCLVYTFGEIGDFNEYKAHSLILAKIEKF